MRPTEDRGFTLVEVLVATVVLTVALVALAELMAVTLRMQMLGRNQTSATRIAQDRLDLLNSIDFDDAPSIQIGGGLDADVENYSAVVGSYTCRWLVVAGPDGDANLRQVTIRVIPANSDRRIETPIELVSIVSGL